MDSGKNSDNDFSMDTKPPQSDIDPGQTKVATKTLLALRAGCPPPPLLLLPCLGSRSPFPAPWDSMGPGSVVVMSREWEKEWWEWCMRVLEASDLQPVLHRVFYIDSPECYRSHCVRSYSSFFFVVGMDTNT